MSAQELAAIGMHRAAKRVLTNDDKKRVITFAAVILAVAGTLLTSWLYGSYGV